MSSCSSSCGALFFHLHFNCAVRPSNRTLETYIKNDKDDDKEDDDDEHRDDDADDDDDELTR